MPSIFVRFATVVTGADTDSTVGRTAKFLISEALPRFIFLLAMFVVWHAAATVVAPELLPSPAAVGEEIAAIVISGSFLFHLTQTLRRVFVSFVLAWTTGLFLGLLMGMSRTMEKILDIGVVIGLTIPALAMALIMIMIFGLRELTVYLAVYSVILSFITINFWEGVKDLDKNVIEVGQVFNFNSIETFRHAILPQLLPYMLAAGRYGLSTAWKIVVITEFLGFGNGIGYKLTQQYNLFNMAGVLAWTLTFAVVMLAIEYGFFKTIERQFLAWRSEMNVQRR